MSKINLFKNSNCYLTIKPTKEVGWVCLSSGNKLYNEVSQYICVFCGKVFKGNRSEASYTCCESSKDYLNIRGQQYSDNNEKYNKLCTFTQEHMKFFPVKRGKNNEYIFSKKEYQKYIEECQEYNQQQKAIIIEKDIAFRKQQEEWRIEEEKRRVIYEQEEQVRKEKMIETLKTITLKEFIDEFKRVVEDLRNYDYYCGESLNTSYHKENIINYDELVEYFDSNYNEILIRV